MIELCIRIPRLLGVLLAVFVCATAQSADSFTVPQNTADVLRQYCIECHGAETSEGNVRFDSLTNLTVDARLDLLNMAKFNFFYPKFVQTRKLILFVVFLYILYIYTYIYICL